MIGYRDLFWRGDALYRDGSKTVLARVIPDGHYPAMWRARMAAYALAASERRT
jgi:hypothetical protein